MERNLVIQRLIFFGYGDYVQRDLVEVSPATNVFMIADDERDLAAEFPAVLAIKQVSEAVIVARNENSNFRTVTGKRDAPFHAEAVRNGPEFLSEIPHVGGETGQIPFHTH